MIERLSFSEKFGYALGDMAANFVFQAMLALQLDFYTHTFGLTAAQAGTLFLVVGLSVAFLNPVMGVIADRTSSKWGKFRPWLLWTALPFGVICVLTFTTPNISPGAKLVYAWVTYILLRVVYTVNNVPYASLNAVMTSDPDERNSISTYRQIAANSAGFIIASLAIPMVRFFGHGNDVLGYQLTMGVLSVLSILFFIVAFLTTKERIQPNPQQRSSLSQDLSDLFSNGPWIVLFLATLFYFAAIVVRGNVMLPYFRFVSGNVDLFSWFNGFGLAGQAVSVYRQHDAFWPLQRRVVCHSDASDHHDHRGRGAAAVLLRAFGAADLVHDGRCGGLRRVEDRSARQRHGDVRGRLRAVGRPCTGRSHCWMAIRWVWICIGSECAN
jgi:sugar (glycoside-pentoside-hexuronide) transporter